MTLTQRIKQKAYELGFDLIGVAPATAAPHAEAYRQWLAAGYQAEMAWLARQPARRVDPRQVVEGARSVVVVGLSYFVANPPPEIWADPLRGRIARYAWGLDYHDIMLPRLRELGEFIDHEAQRARLSTDGQPIRQRAYVDTGPVLEREFAAQAGLGFVGKNTLLISPRLGSYFFLGEVLVDVELEYDPPATDGGATLRFETPSFDEGEGGRSPENSSLAATQPQDSPPPNLPPLGGGAKKVPPLGGGAKKVPPLGAADLQKETRVGGADSRNGATLATCGGCTRCLDICPTHAFPAAYILDSRRCISYLTIELKGAIPLDLRPLMGNWIYGCDACQEVCPWVRRYSQPTRAEFLRYDPDLYVPKLTELLALDDAGFRQRFKGSPIKRTKRRGLLRNVAVALGNAGDPSALPALERAVQDDEPLIRSHAQWAMERIFDKMQL